MPKFKLTDNSTGKSYVLTAPDQASALAAFKKFNGGGIGQTASPVANAPVASSPQRTLDPNDPMYGLPVPGYAAPAGAGEVKPNLHFGLSSSDTLNPLPALDAMGSEVLRNIPVAGPHLFDAAGGNDPATKAGIDANMTANPGAAATGKFAGAALPYALAAELPIINQVMGFAGPWLQKAIMTGISQYALNTGDNLARGQNPVQAATNAVAPTAMAVPLSMLGPGGKAAGGARAEAVAAMKAEGIPLTAGQARGNHGMMMAESQLGGASSTAFRDKQLGALTGAALKAAGVTARAATPEVMDKAFVDAGTKFNALANMTTIRADQTLQNGVLKAATDYTDLTGKSNPLLERLVNQVGSLTKTHGGIIPGSGYKALNTDIVSAIKRTSEPELKGALVDFKEALDDGVARNMGGRTLDAWQKTRHEYANLMRVTDAVSGAGQFAAQGLVTPESLNAAIRAAGGKRQYVRGAGDLNELSRNAVIAMPRLPDSGTASRLGAIVGTTSGIGGAAHYANTQNLLQSLAIAGAPLIPMAAGRMMLSGAGRALLTNGTKVPGVVGRAVLPQITSTLFGG